MRVESHGQSTSPVRKRKQCGKAARTQSGPAGEGQGRLKHRMENLVCLNNLDSGLEVVRNQERFLSREVKRFK